MIDPGPSPQVGGSQVQVLHDRVVKRLQDLVGDERLINPVQWRDLRDKEATINADNAALNSSLDAFVRDYQVNGGTGFRACDDFIPTQPLSKELEAKKAGIEAQCALITDADIAVRPTLPGMVGGEVFTTNQKLADVKARLAAQKKIHDDNAKLLQTAKDAVDAAAKQQTGPTEQGLADALGKLDDALTQVDKAAARWARSPCLRAPPSPPSSSARRISGP